jgi:hypothetical protein
MSSKYQHLTLIELEAEEAALQVALEARRAAIIPRLRGALASIIADPDTCEASKAIARDGLAKSA